MTYTGRRNDHKIWGCWVKVPHSVSSYLRSASIRLGVEGVINFRPKVQNVRMKELCGETNGVGERIDESVLRWFGHIERMGNNRIAKTVYVGRVCG